MTNAILQKNWFILAYSYSLSQRGIRVGTQGRNLRHELKHRSAAHWLAPLGLLSLLSYTIQDHSPRGGISHSGLGPLTLIITQENATTGQSNEHSSSIKVPLPSDSSLDQVNKN